MLHSSATRASIPFLILLMLAGCGSKDNSNQAPTTAIGGTAKDAVPATGNAGGLLPTNTVSTPPDHVVLIETALGNITVTLNVEKAPLTVQNFLSYVNESYYDQTLVHQVFRGQVVLAGGYDVNLVEKRAHTPIRNEADNGLKNRRGTIAMARVPDAIDSATCQFFFNVVDNPALDFRDRTPDGYGYCVFGEVTQGMEVIDKIAATEVHDTPDFERTPVTAIIVNSVRQIQ